MTRKETPQTRRRNRREQERHEAVGARESHASTETQVQTSYEAS